MKQLTSRLSKRTMAVGALALAAVVIALFVLSSGGDGDEASAQQSEGPTVTLERRNLAEQISVDGTLGYGDEAAVVNRLSGTITWLPAEGAEIDRGRRMFDVDDEPVILMFGDIPAYRELSSGVADGPDVKQLEANLAELGFDAERSTTVDSEYTSATSEAVSDWQDSLGLDETGTVEFGRVIFQAGARRVSSLDVELGASADSATGTSVSGVTGASTTWQGGTTTFANYTASSAAVEAVPSQIETVDPVEEPTAEDKGEKKPSKGASGKAKDKAKAKAPSGGAQGSQQSEAETQAEAAPSGSSSGESSGSGAASGDSSTEAQTSPSTQVMTTSSVSRAVTVQLDPEQLGVAKRGGKVGVTLPDGKEVKGRISSVGTVASAMTEADAAEGEATEDATIEVTISLPGGEAAGALDEAPVTVDLTQEVEKDVFAAPVSALIGAAGGEYAIVVRDGTEARQVTVEPGLFADGYVEVEGEGLEEGMEVEVPEE